jgi:predicted secreted protein
MRTPLPAPSARLALTALAAAAALGPPASGCGAHDQANAARSRHAAAGDAARGDRSPARVPPAPPAPPVNEVTIGKDDEGRHVPLLRGQTLIVRLAGDPGTGYGWVVKQVDWALLAQDGRITFTPSATPRPGSGGLFSARFRAVRPGATWLRLVYRRPFEPSAPAAATFAAHVMVS